MRALAVIGCLLLAGCVSAERVPEYHTVCVKPVEYTTAQESQAAAELERLGPNSALATMIADYGKQRAAERACARGR